MKPLDVIRQQGAHRLGDRHAKKRHDDNQDGQLAAYFSNLSKHELLTAEGELDLARQITEAETGAWDVAMSTLDGAQCVCTKVVPLLENRIEMPRFSQARPLSKRARQTAAAAIRAQDLDRVQIEAYVQLLDPETEIAKAIKNSLATASRRRDEFVRANLRLVVTMARRYGGTGGGHGGGGLSLADLIQEGNLGLMHAVSRFDHRRGLRFSTYACWWIRHAIGRALADKGRCVRIPVHMIEAQQAIDRASKKLLGELGRKPTTEELAEATQQTIEKLQQTEGYIMTRLASLDVPADDGLAMVELVVDPESEDVAPEKELTSSAMQEQMKRLLNHLSPVEADVLRLRFGIVDDNELTFREIGDKYDLSRERIRQIQNFALSKLRRALERDHPDGV